MGKKRFTLLICFTMVSKLADAKAMYFHEKCGNLQKCVEFVGDLLGQKYFSLNGLQVFSLASSKNIEISKANAEFMLTTVLYQNGFTRVPTGQANSYKIVELLKSPQNAVPTFSSDADHKPEFPKVWDVVTLKYKTRDYRTALYMVPLIADYLPGTGLVTGTEPGYVIITTAAPEMVRIVTLIDAFDQKLTPELIKRLEDLRKESGKKKN